MTSPERLFRFSMTPCRRGPQRGGPAAHPHPQGGGARADGHDGRRQHAARVVHLWPAADRHQPLLGARWGPSRLQIRVAVAKCHAETPSGACHASRLSLTSAAWPLRSTTNLHTPKPVRARQRRHQCSTPACSCRQGVLPLPCPGRKFVEGSLASLCEHGAKIVRLDAFGYATKKPGTRCFFEVRSLICF